MKSVLHSPSLLSSAINYLEEWSAVATVCCPGAKLSPSEVSIGSGSDRVAGRPGSTVGWIEGPVATAPGTDSIAANWVSGLGGAVFGNQAVLEISQVCGIVTFGACDRAGELSAVSIEGCRLAKPGHHRAESTDKCAETTGKRAETAGESAETAGKCAETTGKRAETTGKCAETAGMRAETAGKYAKSVGEWAESAGSSAGTIGTSAHPPAKWADDGNYRADAVCTSVLVATNRDIEKRRPAGSPARQPRWGARVVALQRAPVGAHTKVRELRLAHALASVSGGEPR
jgi:hypothetical protein